MATKRSDDWPLEEIYVDSEVIQRMICSVLLTSQSPGP